MSKKLMTIQRTFSNVGIMPPRGKSSPAINYEVEEEQDPESVIIPEPDEMPSIPEPEPKKPVAKKPATKAEEESI